MQPPKFCSHCGLNLDVARHWDDAVTVFDGDRKLVFCAPDCAFGVLEVPLPMGFTAEPSWRTWFAWWPVRLVSNRWAWLRFVARRRIYPGLHLPPQMVSGVWWQYA